MSFEAITGNFQNASAGLAKFTWNAIDSGFLKGNLKIDYVNQLLDLEIGTPQQLVGSIVTKFGITLTADLVEMSAFNMAMGSGVGAAANVAVSAGSATFPAVNTTPNHQVLWQADFMGTGQYGFQAVGGTISAPSVKSPDGSTTTYTVVTDYTVQVGDALSNGYFLARKSSALETALIANATLWVGYTYVANASIRVFPGATFIMEQQAVVVTHIRPQNGKYVRTYIPLMRSSGRYSLDYGEMKYNLSQFSAMAIPVSGYTSPDGTVCPYGYNEFQQ